MTKCKINIETITDEEFRTVKDYPMYLISNKGTLVRRYTYHDIILNGNIDKYSNHFKYESAI